VVPLSAACSADPLAAARAAIDQDDLPAATDILEDELADYPGNDEARFLYARVLAWGDRYPDAITQYEQLLAVNPGNADYLLGKARVLYWTGDFQQSLELLEIARQQSPEYEEVWRLEAQVLAASGDSASRDQLIALKREARVRFPSSAWTVGAAQKPAAVARRSFIEGGGGWQALSDGLPDWSELYLRGGHRLAERREIFGALAQVERFDSRDTELRAGAVLPLRRRDALTLEATAAPGADVLPRWSLSGNWQLPLASGWGAAVGWRHAEYESATLDIVTLGGEHYFSDYRASATVYLSKLEGADLTLASSFRLDRYYRGNNRVGLLFAVGRETESVGQGRFVENDTITAALTGLHGLNADWSLTWDLVVHDRDEAWRRGGFRVGLRRDF
jgi:YaiO family outer membrane protein